MIDLDKLFSSSAKEIENLQWYDLISKLGVQSFNPQGFKPIEFIAKHTGISDESTILMVGCGAGGTAVHLAEITGATVYGIDIAVESIAKAKALAASSFAHTKLYFEVGDANTLHFATNMFDLVVIEYTAFLFRPEAFNGFYRVLKSKGQIALAEMMKDPTVIPKANKKILAAEKVYSELIGYQFHIPMTTEYVSCLNQAGFTDVRLVTRFPRPSFKDSWKIIGGWNNFFRLSKSIIKLMRESPTLKKKFIIQSKVKKVLWQNKSTAKFIIQGAMIGQKTYQNSTTI